MKFIEDYKRYRESNGYINLIWWALDQSFWVIIFYRVLSAINLFAPFIAKPLEKLVEFLTKCYLPSGVKIGGGLIIYHAHGIIINGRSVIGENCTLYARVCIGNRWPGDAAPVIGNNVVIGTGAAIFGDVIIPDNSIVKANAVVTKNDMSGVINAK